MDLEISDNDLRINQIEALQTIMNNTKGIINHAVGSGKSKIIE